MTLKMTWWNRTGRSDRGNVAMENRRSFEAWGEFRHRES